MGMPSGVPIVDTMIGFPHEGFEQYDFIRKQTKDAGSREEMQFLGVGGVERPQPQALGMQHRRSPAEVDHGFHGGDLFSKNARRPARHSSVSTNGPMPMSPTKASFKGRPAG